jgi:hypothetical protein
MDSDTVVTPRLAATIGIADGTCDASCARCGLIPAREKPAS